MDEWVSIKSPIPPASSKNTSFVIVEADKRFRELNRPDVREELTLNEESSLSEDQTLPVFASALLATILEDVLQCLYILGECNNVLRLQKTLASYDVLQKAKFGIENAQTHADDTAGARVESNEINTLRKMKADKQFVTETFRNLYGEISTLGTFKSLVDKTEELIKRQQRYQTMEEELSQTRARYLELKRQIRHKKKSRITSAYYYDDIITKLRDVIENDELTNFMRTQYTNKWQMSRCEQLAQSIQDDNAPCLNSIALHKSKMDIESWVHNETSHFYNITIQEKLDAVEKIMKKYDDDMEAIELELQIANRDYENAKERRTEMETRYTQREKDIRNWLEFKNERALRQQYAEKMTKAAIIVQAWWRGILKRLQLGPYRPKREKKGQKSKSKKQ